LGRCTRQTDRYPVQFAHAIAPSISVETKPARAKGVREDDISAGLDERLVDPPNLLRSLDRPEVWWVKAP
jgi:hypothetical protein